MSSGRRSRDKSISCTPKPECRRGTTRASRATSKSTKAISARCRRAGKSATRPRVGFTSSITTREPPNSRIPESPPTWTASARAAEAEAAGLRATERRSIWILTIPSPTWRWPTHSKPRHLRSLSPCRHHRRRRRRLRCSIATTPHPLPPPTEVTETRELYVTRSSCNRRQRRRHSITASPPSSRPPRI